MLRLAMPKFIMRCGVMRMTGKHLRRCAGPRLLGYLRYKTMAATKLCCGLLGKLNLKQWPT